MSRLFTSLASATVVALSLASTMVVIDAANADSVAVSRNTGTLFDTTFDLGFDVSGIPHDPADVKAFILGLPSDWQVKVIAACGHFITNPTEVKSPETYAFCKNAYS
jgi:hypothetical protein